MLEYSVVDGVHVNSNDDGKALSTFNLSSSLIIQPVFIVIPPQIYVGVFPSRDFLRNIRGHGQIGLFRCRKDGMAGTGDSAVVVLDWLESFN